MAPPVPAAPTANYGALSDLGAVAETNNFGSFSNFSEPPPTQNIITPVPPVPVTASFPMHQGPIPNLLTGGGKSISDEERPYMVAPDKYQ